MAQFWFKKDKRVKRISEQGDDRDVIKQIKVLKADGYVQVTDRRNPEKTIVKLKPKTNPKVKAKRGRPKKK